MNLLSTRLLDISVPPLNELHLTTLNAPNTTLYRNAPYQLDILHADAEADALDVVLLPGSLFMDGSYYDCDDLFSIFGDRSTSSSTTPRPSSLSLSLFFVPVYRRTYDHAQAQRGLSRFQAGPRVGLVDQGEEQAGPQIRKRGASTRFGEEGGFAGDPGQSGQGRFVFGGDLGGISRTDI